jgi:hypothetical protein
MRKRSLSSILKALKKVEESGQAEDSVSHPSLLREASSRGVHGHPPRALFGRNRLYLLSLATVLAVAAGTYSWWVRGSAPPPVADTVKEVRAQLPPRPPAPPSQTASPPARRVPPRPAPPAPYVPEPDAGETQPAPQAGSVGAIQAPPPTSRVLPREAPASPPGAALASPAKSASPPPGRPDTSRPSSPRNAEDSLSRLDESKLKVMAIAWAPEPSRRLAVVNGHIVKEGGSVDGFSITQIRKDDIIVHSSGQSWRVELNLKSQP